MAKNSFINLSYTLPVERLRRGHAYGNSQVYCILDAASDLFEASPGRSGLRDSITQAFYFYGWKVAVVAASGEEYTPVRTTFTSAYQETELRRGVDGPRIDKRFFVPYENNHLRSAHYQLSRAGQSPKSVNSPNSSDRPDRVRCRVLLPATATVARAEHAGHPHLTVAYADGFTGVFWGSGPLLSFSTNPRPADQIVEVTAEFAWPPESADAFGLSFAASPHGNSVGAVIEPFAPDVGSPANHLRRLESIERETEQNIDRHLKTARLWTPDPLITRGTLWAKINQLRDYQEYFHGVGFSNSPPSDTLVARDTFWFLVATNYYAQSWSRRLLETWFRLGLEPNGKWIEYMAASSRPLFRDDYGLNINDNTPLMLTVSHHYYALTGDRGFLDSVYGSLLASADYILAQRTAGGDLNPHRLVWCSSTETYTRGLATWRNCFAGGQISGAVTEINSLCVEAIRAVADLGRHVGDEANARRLAHAADELCDAINTHLKSTTPNNGLYLQNISPTGERIDLLTGDLFFPVLCGVSPPEVSQAILEELFGPRFWVTSATGAAGMRTMAPDQRGCVVKAEPGNYGLTGGVWPNLALWAGRAAAGVGRTDLLVKGLRGTVLLADREDFDRCNVTPGEFPEYFNGDDLVQRGNFRSTFIHGSYQWAAIEGVMGLRPRADGLAVNPVLPKEWQWAAVTNLPYRGFPLSILAVAAEQTLYTTARVESDWKQVVVPLPLQEKFRLESDHPAVWVVVPNGEGIEILAASDTATRARLIRRDNGECVAEITLAAGAVGRVRVSGAGDAVLSTGRSA